MKEDYNRDHDNPISAAALLKYFYIPSYVMCSCIRSIQRFLVCTSGAIRPCKTNHNFHTFLFLNSTDYAVHLTHHSLHLVNMYFIIIFVGVLYPIVDVYTGKLLFHLLALYARSVLSTFSPRIQARRICKVVVYYYCILLVTPSW